MITLLYPLFGAQNSSSQPSFFIIVRHAQAENDVIQLDLQNKKSSSKNNIIGSLAESVHEDIRIPISKNKITQSLQNWQKLINNHLDLPNLWYTAYSLIHLGKQYTNPKTKLKLATGDIIVIAPYAFTLVLGLNKTTLVPLPQYQHTQNIQAWRDIIQKHPSFQQSLTWKKLGYTLEYKNKTYSQPQKRLQLTSGDTLTLAPYTFNIQTTENDTNQYTIIQSIQPTSTVYALAMLLNQKGILPSPDHQLIYKNKVLPPNKILADTPLKNNTTIHLSYKPLKPFDPQGNQSYSHNNTPPKKNISKPIKTYTFHITLPHFQPLPLPITLSPNNTLQELIDLLFTQKYLPYHDSTPPFIWVEKQKKNTSLTLKAAGIRQKRSYKLTLPYTFNISDLPNTYIKINLTDINPTEDTVPTLQDLYGYTIDKLGSTMLMYHGQRLDQTTTPITNVIAPNSLLTTSYTFTLKIGHQIEPIHNLTPHSSLCELQAKTNISRDIWENGILIRERDNMLIFLDTMQKANTDDFDPNSDNLTQLYKICDTTLEQLNVKHRDQLEIVLPDYKFTLEITGKYSEVTYTFSPTMSLGILIKEIKENTKIWETLFGDHYKEDKKPYIDIHYDCERIYREGQYDDRSLLQLNVPDQATICLTVRTYIPPVIWEDRRNPIKGKNPNPPPSNTKTILTISALILIVPICNAYYMSRLLGKKLSKKKQNSDTKHKKDKNDKNKKDPANTKKEEKDTKKPSNTSKTPNS